MKYEGKTKGVFVGLMVACTALAGAATKPRVVLQPQSQYVAEHGTAVFTAEISGGDFTTLVWHMSSPTEGPHIIPDGLGFDVHQMALVVPDCLNNYSYNGLYWLSATNAAGGVTTRKVKLTVVPAPRIRHISPDQTVRPGASVSLTVTPAPDKAPWKRFEWRKDGQVLSTSRTLRLPSVQASESGLYECVVTSLGGTWDAAVVVTVR